MAVFGTANGSSPGRCGQSFDLILSGVTKGNQLEVLSKKKFQKMQSRNQKNQLLKIIKSSMRSMNMTRIGHDDDAEGARTFGDFQNFRTDFFY